MNLVLKKKPTTEQINVVKKLLAEIEILKLISPRVISLQKKVILDHEFVVKNEGKESEYCLLEDKLNFLSGKRSKRITNPEDVWYLDVFEINRYLFFLHKKYLEYGFNIEKDQCPIDMQKEKIRSLKKTLIDISEFETNISYDMVSGNLKDYKALVDLILLWVSPFVK